MVLTGVLLEFKNTICLVKKEVLTPLLIILGLITSFIIISSLEFYGINAEISFLTLLFFVFGFIVVTVLHEITHYMVIKLFTKQSVKLKFYFKYMALIIIYDELKWNQYIVTAISPQFTVEIPLIILYFKTWSFTILLILIYHTLASLPDLVLSIKIILMFRNSSVKMYVENNRVKGYYVFKENGECIQYLF